MFPEIRNIYGVIPVDLIQGTPRICWEYKTIRFICQYFIYVIRFLCLYKKRKLQKLKKIFDINKLCSCHNTGKVSRNSQISFEIFIILYYTL